MTAIMNPFGISPGLPCLLWRFLFAAALAFLPASGRAADAVLVTATLDQATIRVGETTTLRFWAKVAPEIEPEAERIFSWYIDGTLSSPLTAQPLWDQLFMPAGDSPSGTAPTSSRGVTQGAVRQGIRNTFLTRPGAGLLAPVELLQVQVIGLAPGLTSFSVSAGTGTPEIAFDFQVARAGGGMAFTGGDYSSASVLLTVVPAPDDDQDGLTNGEEAALGSDPLRKDSDQDGLDDLQEYTFGSSLTNPASAFRPEGGRATFTVGGTTALYQTFTVRRNPNALRVSIEVQSSGGMTNWASDGVLVSSQDAGDGTLLEVFRGPQSMESGDRRFLRVTVTRN